MTGAWPPSSPAAEGELWTERSSPESHMPVPAGHRAPRHSHNRSLPQGRPDTPTADASPGGPQILPQQTLPHHPRGPPRYSHSRRHPPPLGAPQDTPRADASLPPLGPPRYSHSRCLPRGPPDTPTADTTPPPLGAPRYSHSRRYPTTRGGPQILPQQTPAPHPGKSLHGQDFRSPQETLRAPSCRPTSQWVNDQPLLSGAQWHICAL